MLVISQIRVPCGSPEDHLEKKIRRILKVPSGEKPDFFILKHSVDARKKPDLLEVYSVGVSLPKGEAAEKKLLKKLNAKDVTFREEITYHLPKSSDDGSMLDTPPVVIGSGPAGLFAALLLAEAGLCPILVERGKPVEKRTLDVEHFFGTGELDPNSNIQFGEGGAGTYSDGKLTTNVKDKTGRTQYILDSFIRAGADPDIRTEALPHIGTDVLRTCVVNLRKRILSLGGKVLFSTLAEDIAVRDGKLTGVLVRDITSQKAYDIPAKCLVLAPGHSARDLVRTLYADGIPMEAKSFAVGMRVSHPQALINDYVYGFSDEEKMKKLGLPSASYKLTHRASSGRGVYSFCMCPGGYIVNASSEPSRLAVNGMSNRARDAKRANSAVVVTVDPSIYGTASVLDGMAFQEKLEEKAFGLAGGRVPIEWYEDFKNTVMGGSAPENAGKEADSRELCIRGRSAFADLSCLLPEEMTQDFLEGMEAFGERIPGFSGSACLLSGVESRTSSPVRIIRNEEGVSPAADGLYPCGEGAGFAGGIMSAALDGMKTAERIITRYRRAYPKA